MIKCSQDLLNLLYPEVCQGCRGFLVSGEETICTTCRHALPQARFHHTGSDQMKAMFFGRIAVEDATALLYFQKKGLTQKLIHALKYEGKQQVGTALGRWLGSELSEVEEYACVDMVIPVPLHRKRLRKRGYNQVERFGRELARALQKPYVDDVLIKVTHTESQARKGRLLARLLGEEAVFHLKKTDKITGKHLLLVDDVITTGATLEACARQLQQAPGVRISIATMAITG